MANQNPADQLRAIPRIAIFVSVSESEYDIAVEAIESLYAACQGAQVDLFIVDDGSPSFVGRRLTERFNAVFGSIHCDRLDRPEGYFGCVHRSFRGLRNIAMTGIPYDFVLKLDPDTLIVRTDLLARLLALGPDRCGIWGVLSTMNRWAIIKLFLDLLPIGLRKRQREKIQHDLEFRRFRPVWWMDMGYKALLSGFKFRFAAGAFIAIGGKTLQALLASGFLSREQARRHGFFASEEDLMINLAVFAAGHPVIELGDGAKRAGFLTFSRHNLPEVIDHEAYFVHPLKANAEGVELRQQVKALMTANSLHP